MTRVATNLKLLHNEMPRRTMLLCCFAALVASIPSLLHAAEPVRFDLARANWTLSQPARGIDVPAVVPGCVHTDLLAAKKIPNPFVGENEKTLSWIGDLAWTYRGRFELDAGWAAQKKLILRCEGLDTIATIKVNGVAVGSTDNMFRTYEFDLKALLKTGVNEIEIVFSPIGPAIDAFIKSASGPNSSTKGMANLRRAPYLNGWDFAPKLSSFGIYKPIGLIGYSDARLTQCAIDTSFAANEARLAVDVRTDRVSSAPLKLKATARLSGKVVAQADQIADGDSAPLVLTIPDAHRWWPAGMGAQPMYDVDVDVLNVETGELVDRIHKRVGLRTIDLLPKTADRPLRLRVNGVEIFAKGANWVPSDMFASRVTPDKVRQLVADARDANMNMLRCWGGGYYEDDAFFDACDEAGILVWQEFKFACNIYPGGNPAFRENVRAEVIDQVTRLRHHPSIAVWCGNNEVMALVEGYKELVKADYDSLFHNLIGKTLHELLPNANYVGGSPEQGDEHNWWVWHVGAEFEKYRESHGWMTEFGFQSFPSPATIDTYREPHDTHLLGSPVHLSHQRNGNGRGNQMIVDQMARYFRPAKDYESLLWLSQINQAHGMMVGIEHWRTDWPASSGALVWQFNDCWPGTSWSGIDYFGRYKPLQYRLKHAYAPVMVSAVVEKNGTTVNVRVASELKRATDAELKWLLLKTDGTKLQSGTRAVALSTGTAATSGVQIDLARLLSKVDPSQALLWLTLTTPGQPDSTRMVSLVRPKDLKLEDPQLVTTVRQIDDEFEIVVSSAKPAMWVWLECADADARYSDNFFDLVPGQTNTIRLKPHQPLSLDEIRRSLKVRSLFDTYGGEPPATTQPGETHD